MASKWKEAGNILNGSDNAVLTETLHDLWQGSAPVSAASTVLGLCVNLTQHAELCVRANAFAVLARIMRENPPRSKQIHEVACCLHPHESLNGKGDDYCILHRSVFEIARILHITHGAVTKWQSLVAYLVSAVSVKDHKVATAACQYWAAINAPPTSGANTWQPAVLHKLPSLIKQLCEHMVYGADHAEMLERRSNRKKADDDNDVDKRFEELEELRNYAALAFEKICTIFRTEAVAVFKPILKDGLTDTDWRRIEATLLALAALARALGSTRHLDDPLPRLMELHDHESPLVRAMASFAAPPLVGRETNRHDNFTAVLRRTLVLLSDDYVEVQQMALQSLSTMIGGTQRDVTPHVRRIATALAAVTPQKNTRYAYYECIIHLFGRAGASLDAKLATHLLRPLIDRWLTIATVASKDDDDIILLCQALCICARFAHSVFTQHNVVILEKVTIHIETILKQPPDEGTKNSVTTLMVAHLDLLSAMFEGQRDSLKEAAVEYKILSTLLTILGNTQMSRLTAQSALALLGHVCRDCYHEAVSSRHGDVVRVLSNHLSSESEPIRANALWALSHIVSQCANTPNPKPLLQEANRLRALFMDTTGDAHVIMHAAMTLSHLVVRWQTDLPAIRNNVLLHMCVLLRTELPNGLDKSVLFHNVCKLFSDAQQRPPWLWAQFCMATLEVNGNDTQLADEVKVRLRDARNALGANGWNKVATIMGAQAAYTLRKRYRLY